MTQVAFMVRKTQQWMFGHLCKYSSPTLGLLNMQTIPWLSGLNRKFVKLYNVFTYINLLADMAVITGQYLLRESFQLGLKAGKLNFPQHRHFLSQNAAIEDGTVSGIKLNLKVLGIGDGLTVREKITSALLKTKNELQDPLLQYPGYLEYAAKNPYHPLVSDSVIARAERAWSQSGGCKSLVRRNQ